MKRAFIVIIWLISFSACAQTPVAHYVKNGGNDALDGLTPATAWATITKVNGHSLIPGDSVLFNRGDKWVITQSNGSDALNITNYAGVAGNQITYGAFGDPLKAKPIITGRQPVGGWNVAGNWTNTSGNIWSISTNLISNVFSASNRGRLWLSGVEVQKAQSTTVPTASLPWTHNGQVVYVYAPSNPATYFTNVESVGVTNYALICYKSFITIQNIDFRGTGNVIQLSAANNCIVENCNIGWDCGTSGLHANLSNNVIIRNNIFDTNDNFIDGYSINNTEEGLYVSNGCNNWDIYGNSLKNWSHTNFNIQLDNPATPITNIKFHNNFSTCPDIDYGRGFTYNIVASGVGKCTGNEMYNNYFYNHPIQSQISGDGLKFYNNIIDITRGCSYRLDYASNGLNFSGYYGVAKNNQVYNNVIMNSRDHGIYIQYSASNLNQDNLIRNNIIINNLLYQIRYEFSPGFIKSNTIQNNLLFKSGVSDLVFYEKVLNSANRPMTVDEFNAMNGSTSLLTPGEVADVITGNITGDPLFVDAVNGVYRLKTGSPAIGTGYAVGLATDYEGSAWGTPMNIGAFSTGSTIPNPVYLSSVIQNSTPSVLEITFDLPLDNIVSSPSAFNVLVNSVNTTVTGVTVFGNTVKLDLGSPVTQVDLITISYIKPATNPLQTTAGGKVASFNFKNVTNLVGGDEVTPPGLVINLYPNPASEFVHISMPEASLVDYMVRIVASSGKVLYQDMLNIGSIDLKIPLKLNTGFYIVQVLSGNLILNAQTLIVAK